MNYVKQTTAEGTATSSTGVDAVTLEIIRGKLLAIADEMGLVLARSSMSPAHEVYRTSLICLNCA